MKKVILTAVLGVLFAFGSESGLKSIETKLSVDDAVNKFENLLKSKNVKVFDIFYHSKLANAVDLKMKDTAVVVFGSPKVGTLLMQCSPKIAIELPLKFMFLNNNNKTMVAYEDIKDIAKRYNANNCEVVEKLSQVQANFLNAMKD